MQFYKNVQDGYILGIGENGVGTEITKAEYDEIMTIIHTAPTPLEGYVYKLRDADLTWELVELPPEPEEAEAYDILMGVRE